MKTLPSHSFIGLLKQFGPISDEAAAAFTEQIEIFTYPKKTIILKKGKVCSYLCYIEKGLAHLYSEEGKKMFTNDIVKNGEILTSFTSFVSEQPSSENIELLEDSVLQGISFENLQLLYKKYPELERIGRLVAEHHYNSLASQTHRLRFFTSAERYSYFYNTKLELVQRVPLGIIASYLGMTLENLSRIRNK